MSEAPCSQRRSSASCSPRSVPRRTSRILKGRPNRCRPHSRPRIQHRRSPASSPRALRSKSGRRGFASAGISASRGSTVRPIVGGGTGTSFASIPYEDTVQGNVSETRLSSQSSRISLRVDADFPDPGTRFRRLSGYFEMDFVGATPGAVAVTSTSVGLRLRQGFSEVQYGGTWFLAAGQAFTLMTAQKINSASGRRTSKCRRRSTPTTWPA